MKSKTIRTPCSSRAFVTVRAAVLVAGIAAVVSPVYGQAVLYEDHKLQMSGGTEYDAVGSSIAIGSGLIAVGVKHDDDAARDSGAVVVFDQRTGAQVGKIVPADGEQSDWFGASIDVDRGLIAIGSAQHDGAGVNSGAAYVYDLRTRALVRKFVPSDGQDFDGFGYSVSIDDGVLAVSADRDDDRGSNTGSVYLFDIASGARIAKVLQTGGTRDTNFGEVVVLEDGLLAVGARLDETIGQGAGAAYLFDASDGAFLAKVFPDEGVEGVSFGWSVDLEDRVLAVGALDDDDNGMAGGAVYLFDAVTHERLGKIDAPGEPVHRGFGASVAMSSGFLCVGAKGDGGLGSSAGPAYLYEVATRSPAGELRPSDGEEFDFFGWGLAFESGRIAVAATGDDDFGTNSGAAYLYEVGSITCPADLNADGTLDIGDIGVFVSMFVESDPGADVNGDGFVDVGDISAFVTVFLEGC